LLSVEEDEEEEDEDEDDEEELDDELEDDVVGLGVLVGGSTNSVFFKRGNRLKVPTTEIFQEQKSSWASFVRSWRVA
jgi:hypothetical protein